MRYIGSKSLLLENIEKIIKKHTTGNETTFCDIFSGTGVVARYFKPMYEITTNDTMHFSYVLSKAVIENNHRPEFQGLKNIGIQSPFEYLEEKKLENIVLNDDDFFIANNYAPNKDCKRMYLTAENALRIDSIRTTIEMWKREHRITDEEYYYLLAGLIEGVPYVSNITGTYGAYLKHWDKRAKNPFEMVRLDVYNNGRKNYCYNQDANQLIKELEGEILYLDPPYNSRQYAPNYHLLETISKYDKPQIGGVTGVRPYEDMKSAFCMKAQVLDAFEDLIDKAKYENILLSYNTDGLMTVEQIVGIMRKYAKEGTFHFYSVPYRKYKGKKNASSKSLYEHMFIMKKELHKRQHVDMKPGTTLKQNKILVPEKKMILEDSVHFHQTVASRKRYIKSPLNYVGNKYKLLPQLLPLFPKNINTFVDLFAGALNVSINANANTILCNDINSKIIEVFEAFEKVPLEEILKQIDSNIKKYRLSKTNEEGFKKFRSHYNKTKDPIDLYTLTCFAFNYQFRFNNRLEYNNPFGKDRSQFSDSMRKNLIAFVKRLQEMQVEFSKGDFSYVSLDRLGSDDFIYCDPPYMITTGTYNDGKRGFKDWREEEEQKLHDYLDRADARGIRFAFSNVIEHKGKKNHLLEEWSKKYHVIELNRSYSNASYNTSRDSSREVLIVNYDITNV